MQNLFQTCILENEPFLDLLLQKTDQKTVLNLISICSNKNRIYFIQNKLVVRVKSQEDLDIAFNSIKPRRL